MPSSLEFALVQAVAELQQALNRWALGLGVQTLEVTGRFDKKTSDYLLQIVVAYLPSSYEGILGWANLDAQGRINAVRSVTADLNAAADEALRDTGTEIVFVNPDEGTVVYVEDAVEEKNQELEALGLVTIASKVVGGGGFPWAWVAAGSIIAVGGAFVVYWTKRR